MKDKEAISCGSRRFDYNPNHVSDTEQHNFHLSTGLVIRLGDN